jgi:hypothetical protein
MTVKEINFDSKDLKQFDELGISLDKIYNLIEHFIKGFDYINLDRPAAIGDGIVALGRKNADDMISLYDKHTSQLDIVKFVPASGAASRMFQDMFAYVTDPSENRISHEALKNINEFAFADELHTLIEKRGAKSNLTGLAKMAHFILEEDGLNYGHLPKGLIKFHQYPDESRTAFEEHLIEGAMYAKGKNDKVNIHFTISPIFEAKIKAVISIVQAKYEEKYGAHFNITFSEQEHSTDTLAVDENNRPFRDKDGSILFRPGGHGALIENLNKIDADMIFIKNIDNVVPDRIKPDTVRYKKILAGELIHIQEVVETILLKLDQGLSVAEIPEVQQLEHELIVDLTHKNEAKLRKFLMRPIRICGMVKNEGEPGGGPFWVIDPNGGDTSLQIVESSQVDKTNVKQMEIMKSASHFNPVDLVCWVRDYKGNKFDLTQFVDEETGFISEKSKYGKPLKAQELPGLWNGAMANWITLFVEVPQVTFNPVKTLNDLLRENHK